MGLLDGRVALVTGSSQGIGRGVALAYAAEGASVVVTGRDAERCSAVAAEITGSGQTALAIPADVTRDSEARALVELAQRRFGRVDVLVNNAGIVGPLGRFGDITLDDWQAVIDVNVLATVRCIQLVLPGMLRHGFGRIINVGSNAARSDEFAANHYEHVAYGASKAAVVRITECLAAETKGSGITVNSVGATADTMLSNTALRAEASIRGLPLPPVLADIPSGRLTDPGENALVFVFLASPLADHVTGAYLEANAVPTHLLARQATAVG